MARKAAAKTTVKFGTGSIEVDVDEQQPALVAMSDDELKDAGRKLAGLCRDLKELTTKHQGLRAEMKKERTDVRDEIDAVSQTPIRQQGR